MNTNLCWFCEKNSPALGAGLKKRLYKLIQLRNAVIVKQLKYSVTTVDIPRCAHCARLHAKGKRAFWWPTAAGGLIGLPATLPGLIIGGGIGLLIGYTWQKRILKKNTIKPASDASLEAHPLLSGLMSEGWQLSKPT